MRTKVVGAACGLAFLVLTPVVYFHFAPATSTPPPAAPVAQESVPAPLAPAAPAPHHRAIRPANDGEGVVAADAQTTSQADYADKREAELTQLGMSDDPADLKTILSELNNKNPEIRKSALDATVQFGSKDAIPALQNEMAWTDDPQEKVDIQNAIKYLQLPSFQEFTAQQQTATGQPPAN